MFSIVCINFGSSFIVPSSNLQEQMLFDLSKCDNECYCHWFTAPVCVGKQVKGVIVDELNPESFITEDSCMWTADAVIRVPLVGSLVVMMVWVPMTMLSAFSSMSSCPELNK
jgi:hypothetical protein